MISTVKIPVARRTLDMTMFTTAHLLAGSFSFAMTAMMRLAVIPAPQQSTVVNRTSIA